MRIHFHFKRFSLALLVAGGLAACEQSGLGGNDDGGAMPDMADGAQRQTLTIGPIALQPGQEGHYCTRFRLPSTEALDVVKLSATLLPGSHHLILYKSTASTEQKDIYPCMPLDIRNGEVPIYIAETEMNNTLPLPPGVAYHLEPGQMLRLEAHYINATSKPIEGKGTVELTLGAKGTYIPADIMFCGSVTSLFSPGVPPGMTTLPAAYYKPPAGVKVFGLTTHQHMRGTLMTVDKATSKDDPSGQNLVMGAPYDNPPFRIWTAPNLLTFEGNEGFRWQCHYNNTGSKTYRFGQSAEDDEMCFLWAYYYPSQGRFISQECWK